MVYLYWDSNTTSLIIAIGKTSSEKITALSEEHIGQKITFKDARSSQNLVTEKITSFKRI